REFNAARKNKGRPIDGNHARQPEHIAADDLERRRLGRGRWVAQLRPVQQQAPEIACLRRDRDAPARRSRQRFYRWTGCSAWRAGS
ncbi:MAG: hypothetical protein AB7F35_29510, partial [Acetobacteraceae bacterium]